MTGIGLTKREQQIKELRNGLDLLKKENLELNKSSSIEESDQEDEQGETYTQARKDFIQLIKDAKEERSAIVEARMRELETPFPVLLDSTKNALGNETFAAMCLEHWSEFPSPPTTTSAMICLGGDNTFYKAPLHSIVGIIPEQRKDSESWKKPLEFAKTRKSWEAKPSKMRFTKGTKVTAKSAFTVPPVREFESIKWSAATELNIKAQSARTKKLKKAARAVPPEQDSEDNNKNLRKQIRKAERNLRTALRIKKELESEKELGWFGFKSTLDTLISAGAIDRETLDITPLGHVARELYGENELWMAAVFTHQNVQLLSPPTLAALVSAFVAPEVCTRPNITIGLPPPKEIPLILESLEDTRRQLYEFEVTTGFVSQRAIRGLEMDPRAAGLVDAWAAGCSWTQLMQDTNLDDGDLARLLLRTGDILRQGMMSNYLLEPLRRSAAQAQKAMNRKPIQDLFQ